MPDTQAKTCFTPGPWTLEQHDWADGYGFWWQIMARHAQTSALCELADTALPEVAWHRNPMGEIPPAENLMNAHLIAAAPVLHAALIETLKYLKSQDEALDLAELFTELESALARAEGRNV